jgi:hypothetical protein
VTQIIGISNFSVVERVPVNLPSRVGRHARIVACHIYTGDEANVHLVVGWSQIEMCLIMESSAENGVSRLTWERRRR